MEINPYLIDLVEKFPDLDISVKDINDCFQTLVTAFRYGKKALVCGNGGSSSDSDHIVGELMKGFKKLRPIPAEFRNKLLQDHPSEGLNLCKSLQGALPAISLTAHSSLVTAILNDLGSDMIFAQQVYGYGQKGDVLLGISTSGNSQNVINAFKVARSLGIHTIALTGNGEGELVKESDIAIKVPYNSVENIQERHLPIYHTICLMLEDHFFKK
ncbi:D-sedoheptulose-7-phosphate isomerase [Cytobacillus oceanisediminis]|uniref:D-sedoheptulose-7-phosphate isomerase n=1 Tax=Cytobacillus oceanisediminis TaxID=665099 RepID=UPI001C21FB92|nr:SIS domain-containing protein [Cytobacillus oceanisediminis]MBU8772043.1 SIS domain-containing protein [Cytobacillus oceanisediminis]